MHIGGGDARSGSEYLYLIGRLREISEALLKTKIEGFLELFGLAPAADQAIASYSKGMRQKIVISAALLHDPASLADVSALGA